MRMEMMRGEKVGEGEDEDEDENEDEREEDDVGGEGREGERED